MPAFESVAWLVEDYQALDLGDDEVGYGGYRGLLGEALSVIWFVSVSLFPGLLDRVVCSLC